MIRLDNPPAAAPRGLCTDCGLSRTALAGACGTACQFIRPDYPARERAVHGREAARGGDEGFFGVVLSMHRATMTPPAEGAQWTGITTALAARALRSGGVDAVLTMVADPDDRWRPVPALITDPVDLAQARGMRMGYAPLLALLETAASAGHRRLAVVGIPCQVHALRAVEARLGLEALVVIGTPCSDNTTTENFHRFLGRLTSRPEEVSYLEFRADYRVELRFRDGAVRTIPFLKLPLSDLPDDFFPLTCRTCVDYANRLSDVTVGYMGGDGEQWLIVRNERGRALVEGLEGLRLSPPTTRGRRGRAVAGFVANTEAAAGGLPVRRMPGWARPLAAFLQPRIGPRGLEFARARIEMKAVESILHLRRRLPARMRWMIPEHVWRQAEPYGLRSAEGERRHSSEAPCGTVNPEPPPPSGL
ncbi:coenzyme F420 hydrogenase subunit beta [Hasllibacter halocynthiae]|uniref:Coenzyme F420 hydrogenase subunit beta n=1 Tax=Hasllibacter halocynthiae TaxID=595589 RepID=A0A2T0X200_9RHOB|nr:Coenzyme F420 hydrogenase/dehydrogenase, beta subunit C-terminal domain [Hasllibacter halocynthiae]PRY92979.1 coenzyme F420 hydrogenase subunit beta [Hasllibacter halocynthiae]